MIIKIQTDAGEEVKTVNLDQAIDICRNGIEENKAWIAVQTEEGDHKICTTLDDFESMRAVVADNILSNSKITMMQALKSGEFTISAFAREDLEDDEITLSISVPRGEVKVNLDHGVDAIATGIALGGPIGEAVKDLINDGRVTV